MTEKQVKRLYFPAWNGCAKKWGWVMRRREGLVTSSPALVANLEEQEAVFRGTHGPAGEAGLRVVTMARQMAMSREGQSYMGASLQREEERGRGRGRGGEGLVTAEDLRHACNVVAVGKESSKGLNNKETNRCVALFRLLADSDSVAAVREWLHPEEAELRGMVKFVERLAPEGLLRTIFRNAYGTAEWREGNKQQVVWLLKQVKGRTREFRGSVGESVRRGERERVRDPELEPF